MGGFEVLERAAKSLAPLKRPVPSGPSRRPESAAPPAPQVVSRRRAGVREPDRLVLSSRPGPRTLAEGLRRWAEAAKTPREAMEVFDKAHELGLRGAESAALKRAIDLCDNQRDGLQVAKTADFFGYREAADYAYKVVETLPGGEELP